MVLRQECKDALLRSVLPFLLGDLAIGVIGIGVACIDLNDIVDQTHQHHAPDVHRLVGILPQKIRHYRHVPRMLGIVLSSSVLRDVRLAEYILYLVYLKREGKLLF